MKKRSLSFIVAPILALTLVAVLLLAVRSSAQTQTGSQDGVPAAPAAVLTPTPAPPAAIPAATAQPPVAPSRSSSPVVSTIPSSAPAAAGQDADVLVVVNGETLRADRLALAQAVDQVMAGMLATEPAQPSQLLEQMVNGALVAHQLAAAGAAPAVDTSARLDSLLGAAGKTEAGLDDALAAAGVKRTEFNQYFADLLTVQEFARRAAAAEGSSVDAYIGALQAAAHISYGPAATGIQMREVSAPTTTAAATAAPTEQASSPAASAVTAAPADDEPRGLAAGQLAPDFTLAALGEETQTTFADLLGQPLVLSFWTTWCPYCLRQTPVLVAAAGRYSDSVRFVGVNVGEDAAAVAPYVEQHAIPYSILLDRDSQAASAYAVEGYPTTYFLEAAGHIVAHHIGSLSEEQLTQYVEQLIAPKS